MEYIKTKVAYQFVFMTNHCWNMITVCLCLIWQQCVNKISSLASSFINSSGRVKPET